MRHLLILCLIILSITSAHANDIMPNTDGTGQLIFSRDKLVIYATGSIPVVMPDIEAPKDKDPKKDLNVGDKDPKTGQTIIFKKESKETPAPDNKTDKTKIVYSSEPREVSFSTEVRDESAFQLEWLPSLHNLTNNSAYLVLQPVGNMIHIGALRTPVKLDIVIIRPNGRVLAIMPDISPSSLGNDIDAGEDVRGILFLKAGMAQLHGIRPNDEVRHHGFNLDPKVLK